MKKKLPVLLVLGLVALGVSSPASADLLQLGGPFGFQCTENNSGASVCATYAAQMSMEVWGDDANAAWIEFRIFNAGENFGGSPQTSTITELYLQNSDPESLGAFAAFRESSSGVAFHLAGSYSDDEAPNVGYLGAGFTVNFDAKRDSGKGGVDHGIDPGEWLGVSFNLAEGFTAGEVLSLVGIDKGIDVGLHVQSLAGGKSEGMVILPQLPMPTVPEPASMLLLGTGLLGASLAARRRKR